MNLSQTMDSYKFAQYFNDARYSSPQGSQYFSDDQIDKILKYQSGQLTEGLVDAGNGYWKNPYDRMLPTATPIGMAKFSRKQHSLRNTTFQFQAVLTKSLIISLPTSPTTTAICVLERTA